MRNVGVSFQQTGWLKSREDRLEKVELSGRGHARSINILSIQVSITRCLSSSTARANLECCLIATAAAVV